MHSFLILQHPVIPVFITAILLEKTSFEVELLWFVNSKFAGAAVTMQCF